MTSTPLIESRALAKLFNFGRVLLKLENSQPTGSFKDRAMRSLIAKLKAEGGTQIVASSGGNAGVAAAYAARKQGLPAKVFLPTSTPAMMQQRLLDQGAEIEVIGNFWNEADAAAREFIAKSGPTVKYAPPFNHPAIWEGNSTVMTEVATQLSNFPTASAPDLVVCSVGGGGLLGGIVQGLNKLSQTDAKYWENTSVLGVETEGAASFCRALEAQQLVTLDEITSIAHSLGARTVAQGVLDLALDFNRQKKLQGSTTKVDSLSLSDEAALEGCKLLLEEHRLLVEPACGVSIAALEALSHFHPKETLEKMSVVVIVCGGSAINLQVMEQMYNKIRQQAHPDEAVKVAGSAEPMLAAAKS